MAHCMLACFRDFAEAIFEKQKREVAALDSGGWNVGNVVEARRRCCHLSFSTMYRTAVDLCISLQYSIAARPSECRALIDTILTMRQILRRKPQQQDSNQASLRVFSGTWLFR